MNNVFRFVCIYRPPSSDIVNRISFINALENQIIVKINNRPICLMGDFNIIKIDWSIFCTFLDHTSVDTKLLLFSHRACSSQTN